MTTSNQMPGDLLQRITSLATHDRDFRRMLLDDPGAAVQAAFGVAIPSGVRLQFMERPPEADAVIVLDTPEEQTPADGSLSEADLDAVAGGRGTEGRGRTGTAKW